MDPVMKQILQSLNDGSTRLADVPAPGVRPGHVLVRTSVTLISAGTERMLVEFGKSDWIQRARQQPDKVRMVRDKVGTDGLAATIEAVRGKLDQPVTLGYCNVGTVIGVGDGVSGFACGDRVASNGPHAEIVCVPVHLCARVPELVSDEQAAFTVISAIALQGLRLAEPTMGECVAVMGLGLVGLLSVQLLRAQGCRVLGLDPDPDRRAMARRFGAEVCGVDPTADPIAFAAAFSRGRGVDAVLVTASTSSSAPMQQAARMCRKRGRIVLVGVTGLELSRADFFEKELTFQVSCSYGPGRYDPDYELGGRDYPVGFVRWTEQRNFEAVLDLMADGAVDVAPLITHRFGLDAVPQAYALLTSGESSLGIVLEFASAGVDMRASPSRQLDLSQPGQAEVIPPGGAGILFVGAGNYAGRMLIPAFAETGGRLVDIVSAGGVTAAHQGRKHGFKRASTDFDHALRGDDIDTVVLATRHDLHARQVLAALRAGKHVFCEKPLALHAQDLAAIEVEAAARPDQRLMVGFNRRFAPMVQTMAALLSSVDQPKAMVMMVNAGRIPAEHWTQDLATGGGRLVGEGCHFIDLLRFLAAAPIIRQSVSAMSSGPGAIRDSATVSLEFEDGSIGTLHYLANGAPGFPKERLEVACAGRVLQMDNYRRLRAWGWPNLRSQRAWRQDKGQRACAQAFMDAIRGQGASPIPLSELIEVSRASIAAQAALA